MDLRIKISKERFLSLQGYELGQELIQLPILQVRGQSLEKKREVYETLTPGQKSLFAFWVMYGHTQSGWLQFYREGWYGGGYERFLPMIKAGLKQINAQAMLENVVEAEKLYSAYKDNLQAIWNAEAPQGVVFEKLTQEFDSVDARLFSLLEETYLLTRQLVGDTSVQSRKMKRC